MSSIKYIMTYFNHRNTLKQLSGSDAREMLSYYVDNKTGQTKKFDSLYMAADCIKYLYENNKLAKFIGDKIIDKYCTDEDKRSFFNTDLNRLNYVVRSCNGQHFYWDVDKEGTILTKRVILPLLIETSKIITDHMDNEQYKIKLSKNKSNPVLLDEYLDWQGVDFKIREDVNGGTLQKKYCPI